MPVPVACTIVSGNYLPFARVFAHSFREHHPDGEVWVCLVDRRPDGVDLEAEPFRVLLAEDLGIPAFQNFAFRYSILELNTAVKPYFLARLGELAGYDAVCYFDPDILVLDDLSPIYRELADADVVLTPHVLQPLEDDKLPTERDLLLSGIYNLGFLGIRLDEGTREFLDWWQRRLHRFCEHRVEQGLFVDQRWMDFAPAFLERARILRDPGVNVAYWNLAHRRLIPAGEGYRVGDVPLRFFHFSGFHPDRPDVVSRYQNRIRFEERPDVRPLFEHYARLLQEAGVDDLGHLPYAYGRFDNGVRIPVYARETLKLIDPFGERWRRPFETSGGASFYDWLVERLPASGGYMVPRMALILWDLRADLQQHFPSPLDTDVYRFLSWYANELRTSPELDEAFAPFLPPTEGPPGDAGGGKSRDRVAALPSSLAHLVGDSGFRVSRGEARWLCADAGFESRRRPRVPRLAMILHRHRADLLASFPEPLGRNREDFALWYVTFGKLEYRLPGSLTRLVLKSLRFRTRWYARLWWAKRVAARRLARWNGRSRPLPRLAPEPVSPLEAPAASRAADAPGLNVVGWVNSPTGVGEVCRATLEALAQVGLPFSVWPLKHPGLEDASARRTEELPNLPHGLTLYHVNADMMAWVESRLPLRSSRGHLRIGYWFWELAHFPLHLADSFRYVDELWAPTRFCQEAYTPLSPVEVRWVPPAVCSPETEPIERSELGIPEDAYVAFFAFDALSVPERKNPFGLIDAFSRALELTERKLHLLLKVSHGEDTALLESIRQRTRGLPVTLVTKSLGRRQMSAMTGLCDVYVSLHRSEGLGLPLIEAMYLGKPVVATRYGGCTDFLDDETGWIVDHDLVTLDRNYGPYPAGAVWAEPDPAHAASLIAGLAAAPDEAAERVQAALRRVRDLYAPAVAGLRFRQEVQRLLGD